MNKMFTAVAVLRLVEEGVVELPEFAKNCNSLRTHSDYVNLYGNRDPAFEPGAQFQYSN